MKKNQKAIKRILGGSILAVVACFAISSGSSLSSYFSPKIARAGALDVQCDCAYFGGNKNCAANNYGANCASAGDTNCSAYNSNCEG